VKRINKDSGIPEIAAFVSEALEEAGIDAVLSGGAAVTVYAENPYMTGDLDFVSSAPTTQIEEVLSALGFTRYNQRYFAHEETDYVVEFPAGPVAVGGEIIRDSAEIETPVGRIKIITPTHCVMDRLAAFYHWNDPQCLDQAIAVAKSQDVDFDVIKGWSEREGHGEKYERFRDLLKKS